MTTETALAESGDRLWRQWLDWAVAQGVAVPQEAAFEEARARVWEGSDYVAQTAARHPGIFAELLASGELERPLKGGEMAARLTDALEDIRQAPRHDEAGLQRVLRRFRRRQMVRLVWRDLAGLATLDETLEDLTELADCCIRAALECLESWARAEIGVPCDARGEAQALLVLGMGKLGARELNLSSDVDLIFVYPAPGEVVGPRRLANEQFFIRLAQRLVRSLDQHTADGFVFRVDARLRPFGEAGPLAMSFGAMEDYYRYHARDWERYAMIKARVVAGPAGPAARLMNLLHPFVYRLYLDFDAIDSLRNLKRLIDQELLRKGMRENIKLGPGGIRSIEFIGQVFQLIRGGRDPELQRPAIRPVLRLLGDKQLLPAAAARQLDQAYVFLRRVENRLQAWQDKQTHVLPHSPLDRLRLARSMDFPDWTAFAAALDHHRHRVQEAFDRLFAASPAAVEHRQEPLFIALWRGEAGREEALHHLAAAGFADPAAALARLDGFRAAVVRKQVGARGNERLAQLMPLLLRIISGSEVPDLALARILEVLEAVLRRTAYLAMLVEYPTVLSQLARLTGRSPWISRRIAQQPLLLDELLDPDRLYAPLRRAPLQEELGGLLHTVAADDLEQQMERLRQFAQGNMLRVAAADLTEIIPLMVVSDYLTEIAEVTLEGVVRLAYRHLVARHGPPGGVAAGQLGFVVLGYGKLGGLELGYGSDLDLVFLHGDGSRQALTEGERPISNEQFYLRLGQRIIHMLTAQTPSGQLYKADMRLRPDGNKGLLVRSLDSFAEYQAQNAWTWEHQALIRARPVAGDPELFAPFTAIRRVILQQAREAVELRREVREMREKMRLRLDKTGDGRFDLKQGRGGIADIEFMVQYAVLRWARQYPELTAWTDNIRLLETLDRLGLLPGAAAQDLTSAYKIMRAAGHRRVLREEPATIGLDRLCDIRERVASLWQELMTD